MATNQDLQQVNTFTGGMNTDVSDSLLKTDQYREARNLRIVTNTDNNTGELRLIEGGVQRLDFGRDSYIKAFTNCLDLPIVVIGTHNSKTWYVYKLSNDCTKKKQVLVCNEEIGDHLSVESVYESKDNIKLYIADGIHPIMVVNCTDDYGDSPISISQLCNIDNIILLPILQVEKIAGNLKPAKVLYSYRYYNKYGLSTRVSPTSKMLDVDIKNGSIVEGVEYDNASSTGFKIQIARISQYSHIIIYRITYLQLGLVPSIDIIYDGKIDDITQSGDLIYEDTLYSKIISSISIEEYNSISGISIIPSIICAKNNMLFASNITTTDITEEYSIFDEWESKTDIHKNLDLSKDYDYTEWRINKSDSDDSEHDTYNWFPGQYSYNYYGTAGRNCMLQLNFRTDSLCNINSGVFTAPQYDYDELLQVPPTLKGGEIYRYGIVLYHSNGMPHPVKWVGDIRIPTLRERRVLNNEDTFHIDSRKLNARSINVQICVRNLPTGCIGFEVVRAERTINDTCSITQGIISAYAKSLTPDSNLIYPTGYIALNQIEFVQESDSLEKITGSDVNYKQRIYSETKVDNNLLFYSPDISYSPNNLMSKYKYDRNLTLDIQYEVSPYASSDDILFQTVNVEEAFHYDPYKIIPTTGEVWPHAAVKEYDTISNFAILRMTENTIGPQFYRMISSSPNGRYNALRQKVRNPLSFVAIDNIIGRAKMSGTPYNNLYECTDSTKYPETDYIFNRKAASYIRLYDIDFIEGTENTNRSVDITNMVVANTADYNLFSNSDGQLLYKDNITAVGNQSYITWTAHMLGGYIEKATPDTDWSDHTIDESDIQSSLTSNKVDGLVDATKSYSYALLGLGGKCAIIEGAFQNNGLIRNAYEYNYDDDKIRSYVCDIRRKNIIPYGGTDKSAIINTTYYSTGYFNFVTGETKYEINLVDDGDTYLSNFEFIASHQLASMLKNHANIAMIYSIPLESSIDYSHSNGASFSKYIQKTGDIQYHAVMQEQPVSFLDYYNQTEPMYLYNSAYSSYATIKPYMSLDSVSEYKKLDCSNRIFYSNTKTLNEPIDSWTQFQPANFLDVDSKYGEITQLDTFNNRLFFWQEDAFGVLSVHERVLMQDENNLTLMLGTGGVLDRYDYLTTLKGMKKNQFVDVKSQIGLYWWDEDRNELQVYRNGSLPTALSKEKNVLNYLNSNQSRPEKRSMFFDPRYDEVLSNVTIDDESIVFSEHINAYSSIYKINFFDGITVNGCLFLAYNGADNSYIIEWNQQNYNKSKYQSVELKPSITYIINHQPLYTKVFDNQVFSGEFYGGSDILKQNKLPYYIKGEHVNDPLNVLSFDYKTPLKQNSRAEGKELTNREYDYRLAIPRDGNKPEYGGRLRGKTMQCKLSSSSNSLDFSLQHIITKFRISWS